MCFIVTADGDMQLLLSVPLYFCKGGLRVIFSVSLIL